MKNLFQKLFMMGAILSVGLFYSCSDDDDTTPEFAAPSLTVTAITSEGALSDGGDVVAGDSVQFTASATAEGGFNTLLVSGGASAQVTKENLELADGATASGNIVLDWFNTTESQAGTSISFRFIASDDAGSTDTVDFAFNVVAPPSPAVISHTETLLSGQSNASGGSFYDAVSDAVLTTSEAFDVSNQASVDFVFWYGATSMYAIGSTVDETAITAFNAVDINLANLATRNETKFKAMPNFTTAMFDAIATEEDLLNAYGEVAASETNVTGLEADNIFAVELDSDRSSKVAFVKVVSTAGTSGADRAITIQVKIQPDAE